MLRWYNEVSRLINCLLGYPDGNAETYLIWFVSLMTLLVAMRFACMIYGISNIGWTRISLVLLIGILSLIGAAAATSLYLLRYIKDPVVKQVVMFGLPILAFVVFGIPAQCKILKSSFLKMFLAFTSSVLVAIFAINVAHTCYKSLGEGQKRSESIRARSTNFESLVDE